MPEELELIDDAQGLYTYGLVQVSSSGLPMQHNCYASTAVNLCKCHAFQAGVQGLKTHCWGVLGLMADDICDRLECCLLDGLSSLCWVLGSLQDGQYRHAPLAQGLHVARWCPSAHTLQDLYYRRSVGGETDWEWSYDGIEFYSTADLAPVSAAYALPVMSSTRQLCQRRPGLGCCLT